MSIFYTVELIHAYLKSLVTYITKSANGVYFL